MIGTWCRALRVCFLCLCVSRVCVCVCVEQEAGGLCNCESDLVLQSDLCTESLEEPWRQVCKDGSAFVHVLAHALRPPKRTHALNCIEFREHNWYGRFSRPTPGSVSFRDATFIKLLLRISLHLGSGRRIWELLCLPLQVMIRAKTPRQRNNLIMSFLPPQLWSSLRHAWST